MVTPIEEVVARGAEILDTIRPGWWKNLNLSDLEIWNPRACILQKVYGDYNTGRNAIYASGLRTNNSMGLSAFATLHPNEGAHEEAWRIEVARRVYADMEIGEKEKKKEYETWPLEIPSEAPSPAVPNTTAPAPKEREPVPA